MKKRQWQFNWKISVFTAFFLPLLIGLGFWQLDRAEEKKQIQLQHEQQAKQSVQDIASIGKNTPAEQLAFLRVNVTGRIDNERYFLLDNRTLKGKTGFEVISPLTAENGDIYLINRGWVQAKPTRKELPDVIPEKNVVTLTGYIYVPTGKTFTLGSDESTQQWPKIISDTDTVSMSKLLHKSVFPYTIRISQGLNDGLIREWPTVNMMPTKHIAYAIQWFALAGTLLILFVISSWRVPSKKEINL